SGLIIPRCGVACRFGMCLKKTRRSSDRRGHSGSMLAWEIDRVVGKPEGDMVERKVGELGVLGEDRIPVAVPAGNGGRAVGMDGEDPDLEVFSRDSFVIGLDDRDFRREGAAICAARGLAYLGTIRLPGAVPSYLI